MSHVVRLVVNDAAKLVSGIQWLSLGDVMRLDEVDPADPINVGLICLPERTAII